MSAAPRSTGAFESSAASDSTACESPHACDRCLVRPWLLARLAGHLDLGRARIGAVLRLSDGDLVSALAGTHRRAIERELAGFDAAVARERAARAGLELVCRCDPAFPDALGALPNPPAVLHVAGGSDRLAQLAADPPIAVVGARRASAYGLEVASALGRGLGAAGVTVLSGMALGIDSAAHSGALAAAGATVAVLPGSADRAYPASKHALRRRIERTGAIVSELPPGTAIRRWMFPARNRIIAALAAMTVVVEATERSGALITAGCARRLGRPIGAVPGRVTSKLASGPNRLLAEGAVLVGGPQDVLDAVYGAGIKSAAGAHDRAELPPELKRLLDAIGDGDDTTAAIARAGFAANRGLAALASLEVAGYVRREVGGRFVPIS